MVACFSLFACTAFGLAACDKEKPEPEPSEQTTENNTDTTTDDDNTPSSPLNGKEAFSFLTQTSIVFSANKATYKGGDSNGVSADYTYDETTGIVSISDGEYADNYTLVDNKLSIDGLDYYFTKVSHAIPVTLNGAETTFTFTIASFTYEDPIGGGLYATPEVEFTGITFDGHACTGGDIYQGALTFHYAENGNTYEVSVDMTEFTATKELTTVTVYSGDKKFMMEMDIRNENYSSELYVKGDNGYTSVKNNLRKTTDTSGKYIWECTNVDSNFVKTFYSITIEGADFTNKDFSNATITVAETKGYERELSADLDGVTYKITVEEDPAGVKDIIRVVEEKTGITVLYDSYDLSTSNKGTLARTGDNTFTFSYTDGVYIVLTIAVTGNDVANWAVTVTKNSTKSETFKNIKVKVGDITYSYNLVEILFGADGAPLSVVGYFERQVGEGMWQGYTVTQSSVEKKADSENIYVITVRAVNFNDESIEVKFQVEIGTDGGATTYTVTVVTA